MKQILLTLVFLTASSVAHGQVLYLAPYQGDGTDANPFRADSNIRGTECKSLRPNEAQLAGYALCKGPSLPVRAGVIDLSGKRAITKADRDAIGADRSLNITATTFDGLITELADKQNVSLGRKEGRQRISVKGEEVWSRPAPLASYIPDVLHGLNVAFHLPVLIPSYLISTATAWAIASIDETWTAADDSATPIIGDHTWVVSGGIVVALVSNTIRTINSVTVQTLYNTTALDSTDMLHRVTLTTIARGTATDIAGGPGARHTGTGTSTYVYCVARDAASDEVEFGHTVAGVRTADGTVAATVADGDVVEIRAIGDQLSCKHNGTTVLGPITENTGSGNLNIMLRFSGAGTATTTTVIMDNSRAEMASNAAFGPLRRRAM